MVQALKGEYPSNVPQKIPDLAYDQSTLLPLWAPTDPYTNHEYQPEDISVHAYVLLEHHSIH